MGIDSPTLQAASAFVDDTVEGLIRLFESNYEGPVNIGSPGEKSMFDLAEIICKITGTKMETTNQTLPVDDPKRRCPDISLAKKLLDWEPKVGLEKGIEKTIGWFEKLLKNGN